FPAPSSCSFFGTLTTLFPYVLGGLLGYGLMRWLRVVDGEPNHLLEIAGALALPEALAFTFFRVLFGSPTDLEAALTQLLVARRAPPPSSVCCPASRCRSRTRA